MHGTRGEKGSFCHRFSNTALCRLVSYAVPNSPLKRRIWLLSGGSMLLIAALLSWGLSVVIFRVYDDLEADWARSSREHLELALETKIKAAVSTAKDYSNWSETAETINSHDEAKRREYSEANLNDQTFSNVGISAFLLYNTDGKLVLGRQLKQAGDTTTLVDAPAAVWNAEVVPYLRQITSAKVVLSGYLSHEGTHYIQVLSPVTNNEGTGPVRGYLWQLRKIDEGFLSELSGLTGMHLKLASAPSPGDESTACINLPIAGIGGRELGLFCASYPRTLHRYAHLAVWVANGLMLLTILIAEICVITLIHKLILDRVDSMHVGLEIIKSTSDLSKRIPHGNTDDELDSLAASFNRLLSHLDDTIKASRKAEQEKEFLNAKLQQAQKLEAIGTMTGGIAHDFNNLLSSILCSAGMIRLELQPNNEAEEHVQRIETAGKHAASLIKQMLTFSRVHPVKFETIHLGDVTAEVLNLIQSSLPRSVSLNYSNKALEDTIIADLTQIQQVIMNLVTNASHALAGKKQGSIAVEITELSLPCMDFPETSEMLGNYLRLEVRDNGCGIPTEVIDRIFEPYYTTKPVGTGTGLGLAVVHGIISKHKGAISVRSQVDEGTSFHLFLPRHQVTGKATTSPKLPDKPLDILLVDDDNMVRETITKGLKHMGHRVTSMANPEAAVLWVEDRSHHIDLLITDQLMPMMTGTQLGAKARTLRPELTMLLLSGFTATLDQNEITAVGFAGMVMKPVTMSQLRDIIQALNQRKPLPAS